MTQAADGPKLEAGPGVVVRGVEDTLAAADVETQGPGRADQDGEVLVPGTMVGRYIIVSLLGAGTMGVVHAAYDPELDRKVALKVLHSAPGAAGAEAVGERLLREAQALARLSHPNVVAIHDVGTFVGEVWMAMEYVDGQTLRKWLKQAPRRWTEVLRVMQAAGEGLVAAHAAGIVHRDLKPDNIMVGGDGRVRVMDFGLARADHEPGDREAIALEASSGLVSRIVARRGLQETQAGAVIGTPAYMAPEQFLGAGVGAAADVFAFCVSFWEALYGMRPFAGDTMFELAANIGAGKLRAPPRGRRVPAWLRRVIERGLHVAPERRWPGMQALLAALDRGRAGARTRVIGGVVTAAALVVAGAWAWQRAAHVHRVAACEAAGASIEDTWNPAARERVRAALVATGLPYAASTAERVMPWLDRQAQAWREARTASCLDAELHGIADADTVDRTLWCLDERRIELGSLVEELVAADEVVVRKALSSAIDLDPVGPCRDAFVQARLPLPPVEHRAEVRTVRAELARASRRVASGKFEEAAGLARTALAQAEALAWPPLIAAAHLQGAIVAESRGQYGEAETAAETAFFMATDAGATDVAAGAATELVRVVGLRLMRPVDGRRWARHAETALRVVEREPGLRSTERLKNLAMVDATSGAFAEALASHEQALALIEQTLGADHPDVAASLNSLAVIRFGMGAYAEARALHERALAIRERSLGPDHPDLAGTLANLANVHLATGDDATARQLYLQALAIQERVLGPEHPDVAGTLGNLAAVHLDAGAVAEARALHERALAIDEKIHGPDHPRIAATLNNLAHTHLREGELAAAQPLFERALQIFEKNVGPDHPNVAIAVSNLADVHFALGDFAAAQRLHARALAIDERVLGPDHPDVAHDVNGLANVYRAIGDHAGAEALHRRALTIWETSLGPSSSDVGDALVGLGDAVLAQGRAAEALALATRALALRAGARPEQLAEARFLLARASWAAPVGAGRDRVRATGLAEQARDALRELPGQREQHAAVERWLAGHRGG
jgi:tetratricopeptide (TPR) repeat protein/predicted Ser/Thr protein kinase